MSNRSLRDRIVTALASYRAGRLRIAELREVVVLNGRAMEMMPYELIKEIDDIEYVLTVAQLHDEDGFVPPIDEALLNLDKWLKAVPVESSGDAG